MDLGGRLAEIADQRHDRRGRLIGGLEGSDHLDEPQDRHRVEEVHPDDLVGAIRGCGERRDRNRRSVRGEDRGGREDLVCAAEDLLFHASVLDDRLDQEVGRDDAVDRRHSLKHVVRCGSALLGKLREALLHRGERPLDSSRQPRRGARHGDPRPPRPARCRRPSAPRRRRERARTSRAESRARVRQGDSDASPCATGAAPRGGRAQGSRSRRRP